MMFLAISLGAAVLVPGDAHATCDSGQVEVRFALGSSTLSRRGRALLDGLSVIARSGRPGAAKAQIVMTSETDLTGETRVNFRLAERRARAVEHYLIRRGLAADRFTITIPHPAMVAPELAVPDAARRRVIVKLNSICPAA